MAIRTCGILGGEGDPYLNYHLPIIVSFNVPHIVDANYAGNIANALYAVDQKLAQTASVGGRFYYYTGTPALENDVSQWVAKATGKPFIELPFSWLAGMIWLWESVRYDFSQYSVLDLGRMGVIQQIYDK